MKCTIVAALLALLAASAALAGETTCREVRAVKLSAPPVIDGKLDDAVWKEAAACTGFLDEMWSTPVAEQTIVRVGYDYKCIYVSFRCLDTQPKAIVARETKRGADFFQEDRVRLRLNPFNSKREEDESELHLNPLGTQASELAGGRANKQEWEGAWKAAAQIVEDGWVAEMAVPWSVFVRPPGTGKPATLGINFDRYQARTRVKSYWSNLGQQERREFGGQWLDVVMPQADEVDRLSVLGYLFGGADGGNVTGRAGLDARYQFTPSLTGQATLNPDFSNVEGAVTSVDFSYAERLPDERRPFFLEGAEYFSSPLYHVRPFASVRLGDMDLGAKFYGRVRQGTDVGLLAGRDAYGRSDAVLNFAHQFSPYDSVAFQGVSRTGQGISNQVGVAKAKLRRGDWNLNAAYGKSADATGPGETTDISAWWSAKAWYVSANYEQVSRNMRARDGYVMFLDQKGWTAEGGYYSNWRTGPFRSGSWWWSANKYEHLDGSPFRDGIGTGITLDTANQWMVDLDLNTGTFEDDRDHVVRLGARYPSQDKFRNAGISVATGKRRGSNYSALSPGVTWRFFNRLSVGASAEVISAGAAYRQDIVTLSYDVARDQAVGGRLVRRDGKANGYLSYRKSGYGGTETFVILGDPNSEAYADRLVVKVVMPLK